MGTYVAYNGCFEPPTGKKKKIKENIIKLLDAGGMMHIESAKMFKREIYLLCKPKESNENITWNYNYFEDDMWETACLNLDNMQIYSAKVGNEEFCDVMTALYTYLEVEDKAPGFVECNGDIVSDTKYVGWINHVLGTGYSLGKRFHLWENVETLIENEWYGETNIRAEDVLALIPKDLRNAAGGTDLADLLRIEHGTSGLVNGEVEPNTYAEDVWKCKKAVENFCAEYQEEAEEKLFDLLLMKRSEREKVQEPEMAEIARFTLYMPARVFVYLYTEFVSDDFWDRWGEIAGCVYHDEKMKAYARNEVEIYRKIIRDGAISPVSTTDFLRQDQYFTFYDTPSELLNEPKYYLSDADRLYWWDRSGEIKISKETDEWLRKITEEYRGILEEKEEESETLFLRHLFITIDNLNQIYKRIYLPAELFEEFCDNPEQIEYQAMIDLLEKIGNENKETGKLIDKYGNKSWGLLSKNLKFNKGRLEIKRTISVMANKKLRRKYFGI